MIARRQLLGTTGIAGVFGAMLPASAAAGGGQPSDRSIADVVTAINDLRKDSVQQRTFPDIAAVRDQQRLFLRAAGKFPDFIEVGVDVWQAVYDWHVRWQQPITVARDANGRYVISLIATTLVLRPDMVGTYIGTPYDAK